jgi:hypothetical protein
MYMCNIGLTTIIAEVFTKHVIQGLLKDDSSVVVLKLSCMTFLVSFKIETRSE